MKYDFDSVVERRGSGALKYDALKERYGNPDLLPLWVADMDFATPPFIVDAIRKRLNHPVFGYTVVPEEFWNSIIEWNSKIHDWEIAREWLNFIPGIVKGIGMAINVFTSPDDKIIIQPPVYHPFRLVPEGNGRQLVTNPLIPRPDGLYDMNLDNLERLARDPHCRMLVLSNPHNPVGIVWGKEILSSVADICLSNGVLVVSDEIHCDMTLWGIRHHPFASVSDKARACSITFAAPSKTFNIAGIVSSYSVVPNKDLRDRFYGWLDANELSEPTLFAPIATVAAYTHGHSWREQMLAYVEGNIEFLEDYCRLYLPYIKPIRPQASFLVWLDCRGLKLSQNELVKIFVEKAGLALNDGSMFGSEGEGFMRLNVGTPRSILINALNRLRSALSL